MDESRLAFLTSGPDAGVIGQQMTDLLRAELTPRVCLSGGFGFVGPTVKIPKTNIKVEGLVIGNYDRKAGFSLGGLVAAGVTKNLSLGGEYGYNFRSQKWGGGGLGFYGKEWTGFKLGPVSAGGFFTPKGEFGGYGSAGLLGGGAYGTLTNRTASCN